MNRRSLLRFLGLAPIAAVVPVAAVASEHRPALAINTLDYWKATASEMIYLAPRQWYITGSGHFEGDEWVFTEFGESVAVTFDSGVTQHFDIDEEPT